MSPSEAMAVERMLVMPDDFTLSVCGRDLQAVRVPATWVVNLSASGPVRAIYAMEEKVAGSIFTNQHPITDERRREIWFSVLMSGLMEQPRRLPGPGGHAEPWVRVWAWNQSWFVQVPDGTVGGWAVVPELEGLLPPYVWRHFTKRRLAWEAERRGTEKEKRAAQAALTAHEKEIKKLRAAGDAP